MAGVDSASPQPDADWVTGFESASPQPDADITRGASANRHQTEVDDLFAQWDTDPLQLLS